MTKMSLYAFFATFALGMAAMVFSRNVFLGSEPAVAAPSAVSGISGADAGVGMEIRLNCPTPPKPNMGAKAVGSIPGR